MKFLALEGLRINGPNNVINLFCLFPQLKEITGDAVNPPNGHPNKTLSICIDRTSFKTNRTRQTTKQERWKLIQAAYLVTPLLQSFGTHSFNRFFEATVDSLTEIQDIIPQIEVMLRRITTTNMLTGQVIYLYHFRYNYFSFYRGVSVKRGSRHAVHAAKALRWRVEQLLKCLRKITLSS